MTAKYPSLTLEGGLIAADIIDRVAEGTAPGQKAADFGYDARRHLTDEIAAAWTDARTHWMAFQHRLERLSEAEPATSITRDQWVMPLLSLLKYEPTYVPRAHEVDGQSYAISHRADPAENTPPVHIVSCRPSLDRRPESGRPRLAPHSLVQEYLNRTEHLWGIATNGYTLRLLRDSLLMRRQAYIELDLRQMMEAERFSDFAILYRLVHRTRLPQGMEDADACLLERYHLLTLDQGGRVRERLRDGVEHVLKTLGNAFLGHPRNEDLRQKERESRLEASSFYRQLLRVVYRLLFLMVAEERNLITEDPLYRQHYSISRLRRLAEVRAAYSGYEDLWLGLQTTFTLFQDERLGAVLQASPLNGDLFSASQTGDLNTLALSNRDFLTALWRLSMYRESDRTPWRRINYSALDVEELGSVYEGLLEYAPVFHRAAGAVHFELAAGAERRSTGSYYTPPELVNELIDHALVSVLQERLQGKRESASSQKALLDIKVCDPACGSGHFLLAAARRLGRELAKARTGDDEPAPEAVRDAIRDAITHSIYGVDKNPLAVDLCKVALWIEGHARGKPLTFLDHRIKVGDSLVGVVDLKVLEEGIPDEAYERTDKEEKKIARALRDLNRRERSGQLSLGEYKIGEHLLELALATEQLERVPDDTREQVAEKARRYEDARGCGGDWWADMTACHLCVAPFFMELKAGLPVIPTTGTLRRFLSNPGAGDGCLYGVAWDLAGASKRPFFHWALEFPEVFIKDGFDVVLSNPPFMGGKRISGNLGNNYLNYLATVYCPAGGLADMCTYFYRRAFDLLRRGGHLGMVATNTIGQGDRREGGLRVILGRNGVINFGRRFVKWPGAANVEVNLVAIHMGPWSGPCLLDAKPVSLISSRLDGDPETEGRCIAQNEARAFQGSVVLGTGFILESEEAKQLALKSIRNGEAIFPYLNGEDLNSRSDQSPSRWIINLFDWPLSKAEEYPDLMAIIKDRVKPQREGVKRERYRTRWWLYAESCPGLYRRIAPLKRVLVRAQTSEMHALCFVPNGYVYSMMLVVFAFDDDYHFAFLQSNVHEAWVRRNASTMRTDIRYTPTDCFDNFPFPQEPSPEDAEWAGQIGGEYHEYRRQVMLARNLGLIKTYNLFNNPECQDADIVRLRELHGEVDRAILACYGWQDLHPGHGFHQNERGQTRYTVSPEARREALRRLLELNLQVAEREARQHQVAEGTA